MRENYHKLVSESFAGLAIIAICLVLALAPNSARAQESSQASADDISACLACHSNPDMSMTFPNGDQVSLFVDREVFEASVHGRAGHTCNKCHTGIERFPHPEMTAQTRHEFVLDLYPVCTKCHMDIAMDIQGNAHMVALDGGNPDVAVCSDCHGSHDITHPGEPRSRIPQTCRKCHSEVYDLYVDSVHGSALIGEGNPDVPSCIDCHGSHELKGTINAPFHLFSPDICANCHSDPELMDKYGLRADVYDTYVSDFHGTTIVLFQDLAPNQQTDKPVCVDCHGVHNILPPDDPHSSVMKENLLDTCKRCHPNARANFPTSWLSHYRPDSEHSPLVFWVRLFYYLLIPSIIGGMLFYVIVDYARKIIDSRKNYNAHY